MVPRLRPFGDAQLGHERPAGSQFVEGAANGFGVGRAAATQFAVAIFGVLGKLFDDFRLAWGREVQFGNALSDEGFPIRHFPLP